MKRRVLIIFFVLCFCALFLFIIYNFVLFPKKYNEYVERYSAEFSVEPALVYAIIRAESNFNPKAISSAGAIGLMQILPSTADWIAEKLKISDFKESQLHVPETNIRFGCYYLNYLLSKFKSLDVTICAYNAGEGVVKNWINPDGTLDEEKIDYPETREYLRKVRQGYKCYKNSENIL